ncbi:hypothetical protein D3C80_761080 [compost metagenome]
MAVVVRIAGKRHVEALFQADQALHGMAGRWVHADLAVPVDGHEAEGRVDLFVHHIQVQAVMLGNRRPVAHPCSTQRIDTQAQLGIADGVEVDHVDQVGDIGVEVIVTMGSAGLQCLLVADALDAGELVGQQFVGLGFDPLGDVGIGRTTVGGVVLVATALWRVVRRRDDDAVRQAAGATTVVAENRMGNGRCRGVLVASGNHHGHAVGRQHFKGAGTGRRGQRVGVDTDKQRAIDALSFAVQADRLADRQNVPFIETQVERAATVPRRAEGNALGGNRGIRLAGVIGRYQSRDVDQQLCRCRFTRKRTECHAKPLE